MFANIGLGQLDVSICHSVLSTTKGLTLFAYLVLNDQFWINVTARVYAKPLCNGLVQSYTSRASLLSVSLTIHS